VRVAALAEGRAELAELAAFTAPVQVTLGSAPQRHAREDVCEQEAAHEPL